ncbi:MAG: hypothetical protein ABR582_04365 [Gemmatimonadaceae bacterium]
MSEVVDERNGLAVIEVENLTAAQRRAMLELLQICFANVSESQFNRDLDEKEWVILGTDPRSDGVWSFSTLRRLQITIDGERIMALFSGDTASRPDTRGAVTAAGIRAVIRKMFHEVARNASSVDRIYWFMISSTYKSYRLLPMLFRDYAPDLRRKLSEEETRIVVELCNVKGLSFDPATGIVRLDNPSMPRGFSSETDVADEHDPHARFFRSANPGADRGERLASLIRLSETNLTPLGARMIALEQEQLAG